jgi:hypothetical protein
MLPLAGQSQRLLVDGSAIRRSKFRPSPPSIITHHSVLIFGVRVRSQITSLRLPFEFPLGRPSL